MGKRPTEHNILTDVETLASLGATVHKARRGGDVTFHGPGQHVVYPVVDLRASELGARAYVEGLEDVMIDAAASFGVRATGRVPEMTGVWARGKKLGAVGVQISRGVASHGFAFNRDVDLRWFDAIVPCGLRGKGVTTLRDEVEGGREGGGAERDGGGVAAHRRVREAVRVRGRGRDARRRRRRRRVGCCGESITREISSRVF